MPIQPPPGDGGGGGSGLTEEQVDDRVAALLVAGANISLTYDDTAGTLTITGVTTEAVQDIVGALIQDNSVLDFTYDDTAGTVVATIKPGSVTAAMLADDYLTPAEGNAAYALKATFPWELLIAVSDETTAITTGTAKVTFRMPWAATLTAVSASLATASSSGTPTVDINEGGTTILSTKLTIDANEKTSVTAATPAVISDAALAADAEITIDIDVAGTGAKGLKVLMSGTRVLA